MANLKSHRLEVADDPGGEPDGGLGCVPDGEGALAGIPPHHRRQLHVHRLEDPLHHVPVVVRHLREDAAVIPAFKSNDYIQL